MIKETDMDNFFDRTKFKRRKYGEKIGVLDIV